MARTNRIVLPDHPHHVIHRGHNRQPVFYSNLDRRSYLTNLAELKDEHSSQVYAYCLMTNHVHLVINPGADGENLSALLQRLAIRHTMRLNKIHGRSGTLWEGRFRSSPIQSDRYLLACCRYIELNPVRAGMVKAPFEYRWSSCRGKTGLANKEWLDEDHCYRQLGRTDRERQQAYLRLMLSALSDAEMKVIRHAVHRGSPTDDYPGMPTIAESAGPFTYVYDSDQGLSLM